MSSKTFTLFHDVPEESILLQKGGFVQKKVFKDAFGSTIHILAVCNGLLTFTVLLERGMDIGEIHLGSEKVSWERSEKYLLHPDNVDLAQNGGIGWLNGFYPAVASIGPELFGTPGEGYTLHGTGSYSPADPGSVHITCGEEEIEVEGVVPIRNDAREVLFEKKISYRTRYGYACILRKETTENLSGLVRVVDDGLHIQLNGPFLDRGGRYVLPVRPHRMLLRDSAPPEEDPTLVYPLSAGIQPIRCYQYVPEPVSGLEQFDELRPLLPLLGGKLGITAEMLCDNEENTAAYLVRSLDCFPCSLIAREIGEDNALFSFEPCRTRPNRMSQKITDGEAFFLPPGASTTTQCILGVSKDREAILRMKERIRKAAGE
jgi:hypothetical protein